MIEAIGNIEFAQGIAQITQMLGQAQKDVSTDIRLQVARAYIDLSRNGVLDITVSEPALFISVFDNDPSVRIEAAIGLLTLADQLSGNIQPALLEIIDGRMGAQLRLKDENPGRADHLVHQTLRVCAIAENGGPAHTGRDAGWKHAYNQAM